MTPGSTAGTALSSGYVQIMVDGEKYLAHRLAWFYETGLWPNEQIDHQNTDKSDNAFSNLRLASAGQNRWNTKGKSGLSVWKGVTYDPGRKKAWKLSFRIPNGRVIQARFLHEKEAAEEWMFLALAHHGEFAMLSPGGARA